MSLNLLDLLKNEVSSQLAGPASNFLGESTDSTTKALGAIMPSLLGGMVDKSSSTAGANQLMDLLGKSDSSLLGNIGSIFGGSNTSGIGNLVNGGSGIVSMLLGNKVGGLVDSLTSFGGVKRSSASTLLNLAAPFIISAIGKQVKNMGLDGFGLTKLLGEQKGFIKNALPAGFGNVLGFANLDDKADKVVESVKSTAKDVSHTTTQVVKNESSSMLRWLFPILAVVALFAIWKMCNPVKAVENAADKVAETTVAAADKVSDAAATVTDAAADLVKGAFANVDEAAKAALDKMTFTAGSIGDQFANFIKGGLKGDNRFRFTNLTFNTGSAVITADSAVEIDNLAAILKAYPGVKIIVEGYTDNVGDEAANKKLSVDRAAAVKARLVKLGITDTRIATDGFGSANPVASNDTPEGKKQNRLERISKKEGRK